jgi:hypothetical protein
MEKKASRLITAYPSYDEAVDRAANGLCVECCHQYHHSWFLCAEKDCGCRALLMAYISLDELKQFEEQSEEEEMPVIRYEYAYIQVNHDPNLAMELFNRKGEEGWEFICFMPGQRGTFFTTGLFKRIKE